jgi:hypothetical protein
MSPDIRWGARLVVFAAIVELVWFLPGGTATVKLIFAGADPVEISETWFRLLLCVAALIGGLALSGPGLDRAVALDTLLGAMGVVFVALGVQRGAIDPLRGILLVIFAVVGAIALLRAVRLMDREPIEIESNWGGLGGGLGGLRFSGPIVLLLLGISFVGVAALIVVKSTGAPKEVKSVTSAMPPGVAAPVLTPGATPTATAK